MGRASWQQWAGTHQSIPLWWPHVQVPCLPLPAPPVPPHSTLGQGPTHPGVPTTHLPAPKPNSPQVAVVMLWPPPQPSPQPPLGSPQVNTLFRCCRNLYCCTGKVVMQAVLDCCIRLPYYTAIQDRRIRLWIPMISMLLHCHAWDITNATANNFLYKFYWF